MSRLVIKRGDIKPAPRSQTSNDTRQGNYVPFVRYDSMYTTILYHIDKWYGRSIEIKNINPLLIREISRRFEYLSCLRRHFKYGTSVNNFQSSESSIPIRGINERKRSFSISLFPLSLSRPQKKGKKLVEEPFVRFLFSLARRPSTRPSCTLTEFLLPIRRYTFHGEERETRGNGWRKG